MRQASRDSGKTTAGLGRGFGGFVVAGGRAGGVGSHCMGDEDFQAGEGGDDEGGAQFCCAHDRYNKFSVLLTRREQGSDWLHTSFSVTKVIV
jgi:hypothetical protein